MDNEKDYFPEIARRYNNLLKIFPSSLEDTQKLIELRKKILDDIHWLTDSRTVDFFRAIWAYFTFLYNSYGDRYENIDDYMNELKYRIGHCTLKVKQVIKPDGKRENHIYIIPKSFSPGRCSRKILSACIRKLDEITEPKHGITSEKFIDKEWNKEGECQYPTCHMKATDTHEIFGGNGVRVQYSIKNGWQVRTCRRHHDLSGGINDGFTPERLMPGMRERMARKWCGVKRLKYSECLRIIRRKEKIK
jgi:hypothetical protein